ncbi:MAG: methyltransferase domain-containing protein [Clostridia bacterium]|nr:methyltransferase domain-containing protein [Clostridia bacterium]
MSTGKPYSALGGAFEILNDDCGYEEWSQYLIKKLKSLDAGRTGLDMGCGNGYFTRALNRAGYSVTGMDISEEMLSAAVELSRREGVRAEFLYGDITKLKLNFKPDFIVAVNDCVNYIPQDKLSTSFSKVFKSLKKGGLFIFDISSEQKLRSDVGNNLFADDGEEITCLWFNTLRGDRVDMDITVFTRGADGKYTRADERQTQYIYSESSVISALEEVGFAVETEGHLGGKKDKRINFICRKL